MSEDSKLKPIMNVLNNPILTDIEKINKLLHWNPKSSYKSISELNINELEKYFMQPYVNEFDTVLWYKSMKKLDQEQKDKSKYYFINVNSGKENLIRNNKVFYFKMIIYSFIYNLNLNTPVFKHEIPKMFIQMLKKVFTGHNQLRKHFDFLFYDINKKYKIDSIEPNNDYKWAFISPKYLKNEFHKNQTLDTEQFDVEKYFYKTIDKYNKI